MNSVVLRFAALLLGCASHVQALASEYRGADWGVLFLFYSLPFALIPIGLSLLLAALGAFRNRVVFWLFCSVACLTAVFFLLVSLRAPGSGASAAIVVTEVLCVLAATLVAPWRQQAAALRTATGNTEHSGQ